MEAGSVDGQQTTRPTIPSPVRIRTDVTGNLPFALLKLALGCFGVWVLVMRPGALWLATVMIVGGFGFGLYELARLTTRKVQVTLSSEGMCDHRHAQPTVLPWSAIAAIEYRKPEIGVGTLVFARHAADAESSATPDRYFRLDCAFLDLPPKQIIAEMRRFAPDLAVDPRFRLWLGS